MTPVDAISGMHRGRGITKITKLSDITSFAIDPNDHYDVMINGEFYTKESLKYCNFHNELQKVVCNG